MNASFSYPTLTNAAVQPGHDLLDFSQIDTPDGKSRFAFFLVQFDKLFVFEQGDGDFVGGYIDY